MLFVFCFNVISFFRGWCFFSSSLVIFGSPIVWCCSCFYDPFASVGLWLLMGSLVLPSNKEEVL